ncbi:MAG TPA: DUF4286 family protein [Chitinophagaceae bacterium]
MFVYNVTIKITPGIHDSWKKWMNEVHIPEVMNTGCFEKFVFLRLLETDESEGPTYAVQYYAAGMAAYNRYIELYADRLRKATTDKWGNNYIAFRTLMEVVD